jgi:ABC-type transport system involved in multi-copper enzyme maturation permease subunit
MKTSKMLSPITKITKFTVVDEMRHKSFIIMFVVCATSVFLIRGCYGGTFMVNGQNLDAQTIVRALSKVTFQIITAGAMVIAALLSMQLFRRERNEGMLSSVLSKPITRWQYVAGKIVGLWVVSLLFMFCLHGILFLTTSLTLQVFMPEYLVASLLCSINLLFVVISMLLLSLLMPESVAFLCLLGVGVIGLMADGIAAASQSQMAQALMQQSGTGHQSDMTWWKIVYIVWPKISGVQLAASSLLENHSFAGFDTLFPLGNVIMYCTVLGALLFKRFESEDIV